MGGMKRSRRPVSFRFAITAFLFFLNVVPWSEIPAQGSSNTITFDNRSGEWALVHLIGPSRQSIEVPTDQAKTVHVQAGEYSILVRYGSDPKKYSYSKGAPFVVRQTATRISALTVTLHKVLGGNYPITPATAEEFEHAGGEMEKEETAGPSASSPPPVLPGVDKGKGELTPNDWYLVGTLALGSKKNYAQALIPFQKAAEGGHPEAQYILGTMYMEGLGVPKNGKKAVYWFRKGAEQGVAGASFCLGLIYGIRASQKPDEICSNSTECAKQAFYWFSIAKTYGKENDAAALANSYALFLSNIALAEEQKRVKTFLRTRYESDVDRKDYAKALKLIEPLALEGDADAQMYLGYLYREGYGVEKDAAKAYEFYSKAAKQGDSRAQNNLGVLYENGTGVPQNYGKAIEQYLKAAEQGNARAQGSLGNMLLNGLGTKKDPFEAARWFRKAAEQGNLFSQFKLGFLYYNGLGVTQDNRQALYWFQKAAEQGLSTGQYNTGVMYENGYGTEKNLQEAIRWYRKAAEQGHNDAKEKLNKMGAQ